MTEDRDEGWGREENIERRKERKEGSDDRMTFWSPFTHPNKGNQ